METFIITIHIIACIALVILVLLQSGKEGMGVIFGGGSSTVFGSSGAGGLLAKLTAGAAIIFFCTSLTFTYLSAKKHVQEKSSVILDNPVEQPASTSPAPNVNPNKSDIQEKTGQNKK
ncbi:preprotein translocase subunit SecG [Desulfonauticus submarinus]|uniref:Protein-export membrane protein SecG n=1 Tax=Desulfonauticus submarinus TaxID=206665 RepID=A0A1G9ZQY6_9BACT|nr:preprotein translocase subunit SecG [Desulfonauticus submarinus]SDN23023.1 preprotein translocase subunit SecG [Desulfonauticus submarinus]